MSSDRVIVLMAIAPFLLVTLILNMLLGDWVWAVAPSLFVVGALGLRWWQVYRRQIDSDEPLNVSGNGSFSGEGKRVLTLKAVLLIFGFAVIDVLGLASWQNLLG